MPIDLLTPSRITGSPGSRDFGDARATRDLIFKRTQHAASVFEPIQNQRYRLSLEGVDYEGAEDFDIEAQKRAIIEGASLSRRLRGDWVLQDVATDAEIDRRRVTLANVPYLTNNGVFIQNGTKYNLSHQMRLRPGIFTRQKDSGELESHVNVSKGFGHRYHLDPKTGVFRAQFGQAKVPLLPIMRALGAKDSDIRKVWGNDIYSANMKAAEDPQALKKIVQKLNLKDVDSQDIPKVHEAIKKAFGQMELDPEVTQRTLGKPFMKVDSDTVLTSTQKLIKVMLGEADTDDRDAMAFQRVLGPEDILAERIKKGKGEAFKLLWKATFPGNLEKAPTGTFDKAMRAALLDTGLGAPIEEINPAEQLDQMHRVTRMGEGGIASLDAIPDEARNVQPSHLNFIDPVHTPESSKIGIDSRISVNTRLGKDGRIYSRFKDKKGQPVWRSPQDVADSVVAFAGEMEGDEPHVHAIISGKQKYVDRKKVDYSMVSMNDTLGPLANMVPAKAAVFPQRASMGSRMLTQALPLIDGEAPLVRAQMPGQQTSYEAHYGKHMGAIRSDHGGIVTAVTPTAIKIRGNNGKEHKVETYNNFPYNRKTFIHSTATVKPGDKVKSGDLLAKSNFTDGKGVTALGKNVRVAYMPYRGYNYEDAIVMTESAAKRFSSEHLYQNDLDLDENIKASKNAFVATFPGKYNRRLLEQYDGDGLIKPGTEVNYDDPLVLAVRQRTTGPTLGRRKRSFVDASIKWDHHAPGIITDVYKGKKGINVIVKATQPSQVGDKFAGRYGNKGVISAIIPDEEAPHGPDGKPYELLLNPVGIISRGNPAQAIEAWLGRVAAKTGQPIDVPDFDTSESYASYAKRLLKQHGLSDKDEVLDPATGRKISGVLAGNRFIMKLHHTAEAKSQGRATGGYTSEGTPAKGGDEGSKRVGMLEMNALLSHGAYSTAQDASTVRGQRNEDYWRQVMSGYAPPKVDVPFVYRKFVQELKASGINPVKTGTKMNVYAMTGKDVDDMVGNRELKNAETVNWKSGRLEGKRGGLFDEAITGGHGGERWSYIKLNEPLPNPIMEEPIRRILGLTEKQYRAVLAGSDSLPGRFSPKPGDAITTGPQALAKALDAIDVDREIAQARAEMDTGKKTYRDAAVRRLGYLKAAKKQKSHPREWLWSKMPVLPPSFRTVSVMSATGVPLVADPNYLYKELWDANKNLTLMKDKVDDVAEERLAVYDSMKAVVGISDPIQPQLKEQKVRGILKHVFGSSPKFGTVQRKLVGSTVDLVGRGTITPNPNLDMDQVGLPVKKAWTLYQPYIVRRLVRRGMPKMQAMQQVKDQTDIAKKELVAEMGQRPLVINRAPVLHRYGMMSFWPQLTTSDTLEIPPIVTGGFAADFDGDAMNFHLPATNEAVSEAVNKLMPSSNLLSAGGFSAHYTPSHEYQGGLWLASSVKSKKPERIFRTKKDAIDAYHRGEISASHRVVINEA